MDYWFASRAQKMAMKEAEDLLKSRKPYQPMSIDTSTGSQTDQSKPLNVYNVMSISGLYRFPGLYVIAGSVAQAAEKVSLFIPSDKIGG